MSVNHRTKSYGRANAAARPRIRELVRSGEAYCVDCGRPVVDDRWQVGHIVGFDKGRAAGWSDAQINAQTNLGPSHSKGAGPGGRSCNQSAGGKLGKQKQVANMQRRNSTVGKPKSKLEVVDRNIEIEEMDGVFLEAVQPPPVGSKNFPRDVHPDRYTGISPLNISSLDGSDVFFDEFEKGCRILGIGVDVGRGRRKEIQPQQYVLADAINAIKDGDFTDAAPWGEPLFKTIGVCVPRRATKTTSLFALALGRCADRDGYEVAYTAQSLTNSVKRFKKDVIAPLMKRYPDKEQREALFKIRLGNGDMSITFLHNGSALYVMGPQAENFRGDGYDLIIVDEAQELNEEEGQELMGAITPTLITRPGGGQIVVAGTAGRIRSGLFWDTLQDGRQGKPGIGIVEYAAPDSLTMEEIEMPEVWGEYNPAIGTVAPIGAIIEARSAPGLTHQNFAREYLGIWPMGGSQGFIPLKPWLAGGQDTAAPALPKDAMIGLAVHRFGTVGAVVAAWRDKEGHACLRLLEHAPSTVWVAAAAARHARALRAPIAHDTNGSTQVVTDELQTMKPRPILRPQNWNDVAVGAASIYRDIETGNVRHWHDDALTKAVRDATKRGTKDSNRWSFGSKEQDDIVPLEAALVALRAYDQRPKRNGIGAFLS
jgi:hypothetical protein